MSRNTNFFEPLESRQMMSAGGLDTHFGTAGITKLGLGLHPTDIAVQADGKTVIVGWTADRGFVVARVNADGSRDRTFGGGDGIASVNFGEDRCSADQVAIQNDGKIVVAGTSHSGALVDAFGPNSYALARFNANGTLDRSFSGDGKTLLLAGKNMSKVGGLTLQPDGKILFVGDDEDFHYLPTPHIESDFMVVRVLPNGSLDTTFGTPIFHSALRSGFAQTDMGGDDIGSSIFVQRDGKIVVAGTKFGNDYNDPRQFIVARYLPDGRPDNAFDGNGKLATSVSGDCELSSMTVQLDGKIIAAGTANNSFALVRYNLDGSIDHSFAGGKVFTKISMRMDTVDSVFVDRRGTITAVGTADKNFSAYRAGKKLAAVQYTPNGLLDASFGDHGIASLPTGMPIRGVSAARAANGKIIIAGEANGDTTLVSFHQALPRVEVFNWDANASETPGNPGSIIVGRDAIYDFPTRVLLNLSGTAVLGSDYTASELLAPSAPPPPTSGLPRDLAVATPTLRYVDIPAGQSFVVVPINIVNDSVMEPVEQATFALAADDNYALGERIRSSVAIADNDSVRVNFQPANNMRASGYATDTGDLFGLRTNGLRYGWDADNIANARFRTSSGAPDIRYATYNHMQKNGADRKWEIAVPNGMYEVRLVAGDAEATDSVHRMNLEGELALAGTPGGDIRWFRRTTFVNVTDGRLTLTNASGAQNNKIAFIDIKAAPPGAHTGPVTSDLPVRLYSPSTASNWHTAAEGLFSDNQIDEAIWT